MNAGEDYNDDRLPWLETVEDDYREGPSFLRIILLVLVGLAIIAAAIFGWWWYQRTVTGEGTGALINAQEGDYKIKPDEPGGMKVEGEGDTVFAASEGATTNGSVDVSAVPKAAAPSQAAPGPSAGSATIQLGSFPTEAEANAAWARLSKRFSYLAPLGKGIAKADVNGKTFYRLRVNAGSNGQARELCGKLKAAGEACFLAGG